MIVEPQFVTLDNGEIVTGPHELGIFGRLTRGGAFTIIFWPGEIKVPQTLVIESIIVYVPGVENKKVGFVIV